MGIRKTGKGGGDLQLSYVEHAFNVNLCKHKSHSLNCSNLLWQFQDQGLQETTILYKPDTNLVMSPNFAEFLLDTTNNGNEILAVLEDIVEVVETGGTDLQTLE